MEPGVAGFVWMSLCFGINHGTVSAMIPLATGEFGGQGDWALGVLYAAYTISAVCCGTVVVGRVGYRRALLWGCLLDSMFVVGMLAAYLVGKGSILSWVLSIIGSGIGGWASGFLWTAQGGYFTLASKAHAKVTGKPLEEATSTYSGIFATFYLAWELIMKILSSLTFYVLCYDDWSGNPITGSCGAGSDSSSSSDDHMKREVSIVTYSIFTVFALVSSLGLLFIPHYDEPQVVSPSHKSFSSTVKLLLTDPPITLLGSNNILFGLIIGGFINSYVTGVMVKDQLGSDKIGYFSSMTPLVAAFVGAIAVWLNHWSGSKVPSMVLGYLGAGYVVWTVLIVDLTANLKENLGTWLGLSSIFIAAGIYRGVWEGTNKAIFADHYRANPSPAFANVILQSGLSSSVSFMVAPYVSHTSLEVVMGFFFITSVIGYAGYHLKYRNSPETDLFPESQHLQNPSDGASESSWLLHA